MSESANYWHVLVTPTNSKRKENRRDAIAVDKDQEWVERRILARRRRGEPIALEGRTFEWSEVERLRITVSDKPTKDLIPRLEAEDANSSVVVIGGPSYTWKAAARATDVTDDLIEGPPGTVSEVGPAPARVNPKKVMVVHGRDSQARRAMFDFLRALNLEPLEWGKLVEGTGKAAPYLGEILEKAFEQAAAVIVLLTPDDEARLRERFQETGDPDFERELTPQARPNVLFEAGMAFGIHPDRTVLVEVSELRPFSDVYGRHVIRLDGSEQPLRDIARRLKTAGCAVDDSGDDWAAPDRFQTTQAPAGPA